MIRILLPTPDRDAVAIGEDLCKEQGVYFEVRACPRHGTYWYELWTDSPLPDRAAA